jgi:hypothetical protein
MIIIKSRLLIFIDCLFVIGPIISRILDIFLLQKHTKDKYLNSN